MSKGESCRNEAGRKEPEHMKHCKNNEKYRGYYEYNVETQKGFEEENYLI